MTVSWATTVMVLLHVGVLLVTTGGVNNVHGLAASSSSSPSSSADSLPPLSSSRSSLIQKHLPLAKKAMQYIDSSSDPFHAVQTSIDLLNAAGFEPWEKQQQDSSASTSSASASPPLQAGGKYYFTKNKSTLVAFCVGKKYKPGNGLKIIAGHTDSPNLRVKPRSKRGGAGKAVGDCTQIGVECYGGGLWHTWFDRDLGLSGRVFVRRRDTNDDDDSGGGNKIEQRLVKINRALLRISNLAIHLQTAKEREAFKYNKEDHLSPILAMEVKKALTGSSSIDSDDDKDGDDDDDNSTKKESSSTKKDGWTEHQEPALLEILANELGLDQQDDIIDFELNLFDIQKAVIGGAFGEFVHSARLDNLASCFMAVQALMDHVSSSSSSDDKHLLDDDEGISMICLYDHEEVGSSSAVGAASPVLSESIRRICSAAIEQQSSSSSPSSSPSLSFEEVHQSCIAKSFVLSSDQAHAVHPNYASKHEKAHQPKMNDGMVIKRNSNQRYATTPLTGLLMRQIAQRAGLPPVQEFIVRQDCGCGSTIGPIMSTRTGIRTIDMGCPQLSMHSIRETMGTCDLTNGVDLFKAYFRYFHEVDESVDS